MENSVISRCIGAGSCQSLEGYAYVQREYSEPCQWSRQRVHACMIVCVGHYDGWRVEAGKHIYRCTWIRPRAQQALCWSACPPAYITVISAHLFLFLFGHLKIWMSEYMLLPPPFSPEVPHLAQFPLLPACMSVGRSVCPSVGKSIMKFARAAAQSAMLCMCNRFFLLA